MKTFKGIDVSTYQNDIDWKAVKNSGIDFAIIRAGYGSGILDLKLEQNVKGCTENDIPYGFYWFSYALDEGMAINEANHVCDIADKYNPTYPLCYDYEYDSYNYAVKKGRTPSNEIMVNMARCFLNRVQERGHYPMLYANHDYLKRVFSPLIGVYDLWYALWGNSKGTMDAGIWQYSSQGSVNGIRGNVDLDISYKDYPTIIKNKKQESEQEKENESIITNVRTLEDVKEEYWNCYNGVAREIINGLWGDVDERKEKLRIVGYDVGFIESIVDILSR